MSQQRATEKAILRTVEKVLAGEADGVSPWTSSNIPALRS